MWLWVCMNQYYLIPCSSFLLHQDVPHGFDVVLWPVDVSTRVVQVRRGCPACAKSNSRLTGFAIVFVVAKDPNSGFIMDTIGTPSIETFHVTFGLQRGLWTNQRLPRVTTQWGGAVLPVSDQWEQRGCLLVDGNKVLLFADLHSKTNLGEGRVPVRR